MRRVLTYFSLAMVVLIVAVAPAAAQDTTFRWGAFGNPVQLDPALVTDGISLNVTNQGCEALASFVGSTTEVEPWLAESWTVTEDGLTWTFKLREGITFHDGTPFNAEAVKWNFDRWRLTDHPQHLDEEGQVYEYYEAQFGGFDENSIITDVQATGEYEVVITLSQPIGAFLNNLAMSNFQIASPTAVEAAGAAYGTPEVGYVCTGPFKFVEWVPDVQVVMERYEGYWTEIPGNITRIEYKSIPDSAARFAALQAGEIDGFEQPNVEDIPTIESSDNLYIVYRPSFNTFYLAFNYRIQEFRDPLVRQAISLAINREAIVGAFYNEAAVPANTMNPPTIAIGFNPDVKTPYDPEKAKELLAQAGFPDGLSEVHVLGLDENGNVTDEVVETIPVRLYYMPVVRPYNPDGEGIANAMAADLAAVGINAEATSAGDWSTYLSERSNGNLLGLYQLGWTGDNGDPDNFIGYFFHDVDKPLAREGFYQNAEVAALLQQARALTDPATRDALYKEAEAIHAAGADRVYIAHGPVPLAFSKRVSGWVPSPFGKELYKYVTLG
ncbi:MAG: ABC transporter substrate-binding protein [Chloroflexi bacterium]|nr:ABC transporter substrate-binding protein [Chloroflexota bacterium]